MSLRNLSAQLPGISQKAINALLNEAWAEAQRRVANTIAWPTEYTNSDTGKSYTPHHKVEAEAIHSDTPTYVLFRGGEGGGKSVAGIIKALDRVKHNCSGVMVSPDFEHFRRSLWPEFRRWCPWDLVVENQQRRRAPEWTPTRPFEMVFTNGSSIHMSGIKDAGSLEGPNINWAMIDEARHLRDAAALKVLAGRIRIPGKNVDGSDIPPQLWLTTTPKKNWLFEYFGPLKPNDPHASFKRDMLDVVLLTIDNIANLADGFVGKRASVLSEQERLVLLEAAWADLDDTDHFLPSMTWWDNCRRKLPKIGPNEPLIVGVDAATDNDHFAIVAVTRGIHIEGWRQFFETEEQAEDSFVVRHIFTLEPKPGRPVNYGSAEKELRRLNERFQIGVFYDRYQLDDMMQRLTADGIWCEKFEQSKDRIVADMSLRERILEGRVLHPSSAKLDAHVSNADRRFSDNRKKWRLTKRSNSQKIDLVVALSMAVQRCADYDL